MRKFILIFLAAISVTILFTIRNTYSIEPSNHNCTNCHQVTNDDIMNLLKEVIPDVKILEIHPAQVKGLWEVIIETKGRKGIAYIDFSKKYVVSGSIFNLKTKTNLTGERLSEINKIDPSQIPLDGALLMGDKNAAKKVIIFTDPECPYCKKLHDEIKKVLEKRKDIAFYIKMYPLTQLHPKSYEKSMAIVCEKSLALLEDSFANKPLPEPKCKTSEVDENIKLGEKLGIRGTPAIILPDGIIIQGYKDADSLISLIDKSS
jgi:thiol:disulfide interchange protein DsbC